MPRWDRVKKSFFDWERLTDSFPRLLDAFVLDIKIFAWTTPCILIVAVLIAIARSTRTPALFPVRIFVIAYTDIMRGVPVILWIYLVGFGVPGIGLERPWNSPLIWGSVALGMTYSAYVAEVFRAGIESVHESQRAAARSLGLSSANYAPCHFAPSNSSRRSPADERHGEFAKRRCACESHRPDRNLASSRH